MFILPKLPYAYDALEPYLDAKTMEIHHTKHHAAYVDNLNKALEKYPDWQDRSIEELLKSLPQIPEDIRTAVRNHGGGHYNHSLFWQIMQPVSGVITERAFDAVLSVVKEIIKQFNGLDKFKEQFAAAALSRFGSGWAWLFIANGKLQIANSPNQDNPFMESPESKILLGLDVWEHAYYLKYQNRRAEYIENWWRVVNWQEVEKRFLQIT